ncbi:MAG: hypothetical protein MUO63_19950 [Desulfobulbaceae bacterium]|nr:hypothetical protein [Desulfobulbaceae bacterium]
MPLKNIAIKGPADIRYSTAINNNSVLSNDAPMAGSGPKDIMTLLLIKRYFMNLCPECKSTD